MSDSPGQRLKAERIKRGLTIEDITSATKMRPSITRALETDDYSNFPSITHARNFLTLYGKFLKVDIKDGMAGLATPAKMGIENYQYLNVEKHDESTFRTPRRSRSVGGLGGGDQTTRTLGFVAGAVAFIIFAIYLSVNLRRLNLASSAPPASTESAPTPEAALPSPSPNPDKLRPPAPTPIPETPFYAPVHDDRPLIHRRPWPRF